MSFFRNRVARRSGRAAGAPTFHDALVDPALFGKWFSGPSFASWRALAKAIEGEALDDAERAIFRELTGRMRAPTTPADEVWIVKGRRAGGSLFAAALAVYTAAFGDFPSRLAPGEVATVMLLAADRKQSRVLMNYCAGFIDASPLLASLVTARTAESISLSTRATIEIHTSSFRSVRGYAIALAVSDELAFWEGDGQGSANPAAEVLVALRPALASLGGRLVCVSSPYARRGPLWQTFSKKFGANDPRVLVIKGTTQQFNPTIDPGIIARALDEDEPSARAEWLAEFRRDIENFVSQEAIAAVVVRGRFELPPVPSVQYVAFTDPSGGSADSMTLAIAHHQDGRGVLDCVREVTPPFSPEAVVAEFAALVKTYRCTTVTGDRYGGEWPREQWRKCGVEYLIAEQDRSALYLTLLPAINSGSSKVELLDHTRLLAQLAALERRTGPSGRDRVDHPAYAGAHDDVVNAAAGALVLAGAAVHYGPIRDLFELSSASPVAGLFDSCYGAGSTGESVASALDSAWGKNNW